MSNRDLTNRLKVTESLRPAVHAATAAGLTVDLQGADSAMVAVTVGAIVGTADDAAITFVHSDAAAADFVAVPAADIIGTVPTALEPNEFHQFGYRGSKRYLRVGIDEGGETSVAVSAVVITGHLSREPAGYSVAS